MAGKGFTETHRQLSCFSRNRGSGHTVTSASHAAAPRHRRDRLLSSSARQFVVPAGPSASRGPHRPGHPAPAGASALEALGNRPPARVGARRGRHGRPAAGHPGLRGPQPRGLRTEARGRVHDLPAADVHEPRARRDPAGGPPAGARRAGPCGAPPGRRSVAARRARRARRVRTLRGGARPSCHRSNARPSSAGSSCTTLSRNSPTPGASPQPTRRASSCSAPCFGSPS